MKKSTFRTSPPATYITPSQEEMKMVAEQVGLKGYSRDLVADLTHLAAGGSICPPSSYRGEIEKRVTEKLPLPDSDGEWSLKKGGHTKSRMEAIQDRVSAEMRYHQNVCDFLQTADLGRFPGGSPLEQAMSLLKMLSKKSGGSGGGEAGEPLPIFSENDHPEGVAAEMHETLDMVDSLSEEERDMLDPDREENEESSESGEGSQGLSKLKVAQDLVAGSDKRLMLDVSRKLDQFSKLQVRKKKLADPDPSGDEVRNRPIKSISELSKVAKTAWATYSQNKSYFLYQAVSGQLPVRERITRNEKKQAIFILLDGSGSMDGRKHWKASGVVMNRLKAVINGDAEVYLSVFDTKMTEVSQAKTPEEAKALIKKFMAKNFSGGGTNIQAAVKAAHEYMEEKIKVGEALYRPEVVVLTDEDTSIEGLKQREIPGTRVHGFAMERTNKPLVDFARSTGGVGVENF